MQVYMQNYFYFLPVIIILVDNDHFRVHHAWGFTITLGRSKTSVRVTLCLTIYKNFV